MRPQPIIPAILGVSLITASLSAQSPKVNESGHTLTLFADTPDIVTPIGMAVDKNDLVFVIESHTHNPPSSYAGPKGDIVKVFTDQNEDGVADSTRVFAEGLNQAMNLAFSPDGTLYALCAKALVALPDRDHDGKCDRLETVLRLETESGNAHGNWLGLDFDSEGKVYLGRGNIGSHHYRVKGKDGTLVEGYGDGGNLIRANPDGTKVEEWATGFWNPMDLKFDHKNRLMLVDNDPDGRGPNRLLEVVRGGDYGYKSVFKVKHPGVHPKVFLGSGRSPSAHPIITTMGARRSPVTKVSCEATDTSGSATTVFAFQATPVMSSEVFTRRE